jgi:DNA processing protein
VGFNLVKGIGAARLRLLLDVFGDIEDAWRAPAAALVEAGLPARQAAGVEALRQSDRLERVLARIQEEQIQVLTWEDSQYPRRLIEIDQPPPVLYLRGSLLDDDLWAVAIVGTRRATSYGRSVAGDLAARLASSGVVVVSGLARGVDGAAHLAALKAGGRTLAVLGSGVDVIYPPEHRKLADEIVASGCLVSDYAPGTAPDAGNFPPRNRIISGLSQAVVVVEASEKSGALITAAFAAEQGRPVFAVPGPLYSPLSRGANELIRDGAQILLDAGDVLASLNLGQVVDQRQARRLLPEDALEARLYTLLGREPLHVDEMQQQIETPIQQITAALTLMELKGLVRQVGSMRYVAVFEPGAEYIVNESPEQ